MKRVIAVALGAAALLAGCSHSGYHPPAAKLLRPATDASKVVSKPAPVADMSWYVTEDDGQAKLAFGRAASQDVRLLLTCKKGSGQLSVDRFVAADQAGAPPILTLASGDARGHWLAQTKAAADPAGHTELSVDMSTTEPAISAFERNGWVDAILADGKVEGMAPHRGDTAIRQFFDYCG